MAGTKAWWRVCELAPGRATVDRGMGWVAKEGFGDWLRHWGL